MNKLIAIALTFLVLPHDSRILTHNSQQKDLSNNSEAKLLDSGNPSTRIDKSLKQETHSNDSSSPFVKKAKPQDLRSHSTSNHSVSELEKQLKKEMQSNSSSSQNSQSKQILNDSQSNKSRVKTIQSSESSSQSSNFIKKRKPEVSVHSKSQTSVLTPVMQNNLTVEVKSNLNQVKKSNKSPNLVDSETNPSSSHKNSIRSHQIVLSVNEKQATQSQTEQSPSQSQKQTENEPIEVDTDEDHEFVKLLQSENLEDSKEELGEATKQFFEEYVENPIVLAELARFDLNELFEMKKATSVPPQDSEQFELQEEESDVIQLCSGELEKIANGKRNVVEEDDFATLFTPESNVTGVMVKEINVGPQAEEEIRKELLISLLFQSSPGVVRSFKACYLDREDEERDVTTRSYYLFMEDCPTSFNQWLEENKQEANGEWLAQNVLLPITRGLHEVHEGEIYHIRNVASSFRICGGKLKVGNFELARHMFHLKDNTQKAIWQNFEANELYQFSKALETNLKVEDEKLGTVLEILKQEDMEKENEEDPIEKFREELFPLYLNSDSESKVLDEKSEENRRKSVNIVFSALMTMLVALL